MEQVMIRKAATEDIDGLELLYDTVTKALETGINYPGWRNGIYPAREDAVHGLELDCLYVAHWKENLVGTIILSHETEEAYEGAAWRTDAKDQEILVIHTFATHPDFRNLGVGKQLLKFAEVLGRHQKMKAIRLDVFEENIPAIRLYEQCGYQYIDTVDLGLGDFGLPRFRLYELVLKDR